jgi:hypothetical protein
VQIGDNEAARTALTEAVRYDSKRDVRERRVIDA